MENKKYKKVFNKRIAMVLQELTGQRPYVFDNLKYEGAKAWSFVADEEFLKVFDMVMSQIAKRDNNGK